MTQRPTNWAGNITFGAARFLRPTTMQQLQEIVAASQGIRALGTGHSFNDIADTDADSVSVADLPPDIDIDAVAGTVTVAAGVRYGELTARLQDAGLALHNLGSLPHISVGGACSTGTHGSGDTNGNLATAVVGLRMVGAGGEIVEWSRARDPEVFPGAVIALGALGIVTHLVLRTQPTYQVRQYVYEQLSWDAVLEDLDGVYASAYSISLFTTWRGDTLPQAWVKCISGDRLFDGPAGWFGANPAEGERASLEGAPVENGTQQQGIPGPWNERLPHYQLAFTPSRGEELQSEFLLPRRHGVAALAAMRALGPQLAPLLQMSELRTVAADDLWLSPSYQQDSLAIHFTWHPDAAAVDEALRVIEARLAPFGARPHWAKVFVTDPAAVRAQYEKAPDFAELRSEYDPKNVFGNALIDRWFPAG